MKVFDRIWDTSITSGTGNITLAGALMGYRALSAVLADGDTFPYTISDQSGANWETGIGTYISGSNSFSRSVRQSSNSNALVNFGSNIKDVRIAPIAGIPQLFPQKNAIINGDFDIWQRGTSFAAIVNNALCADMWKYFKAGAVVHTVSRSTDVPTVAQSGKLSNYSLLADVTTADASMAATDYCVIAQLIEGFNWKNFAQKIVTLSFWVKSTKTGTFSIAFRNSGFDMSYVTTYTVDVSDTWEKKTITFPASPSAGTWDYTNGIGLRIYWTLSAGSDVFNSAPGTWNASGFADPNQVNATDSVNNNFYLSQVQLEVGGMATDFEIRSFQEEVKLCQRYYWKTFPLDVAPAQAAGIYTVTTFSVLADNHTAYYFPMPMRTTPTITTYNPTQANANWRRVDNANDATYTQLGVTPVGINFRVNGGTANWPYQISMSATAEL